MKPKPAMESLITGDSVDTDPVAGRRVMARALEIASSDGRLAINLSANDWLQAKKELTDGAE